MKIRVGELRNVTAAGARSARAVFLAAEELRCDPDCESLFADAARSLKEQAGGQLSRTDAGQELFAQLFVAKKLDDCHIEIWLRVALQAGGLRG